MSPSPSATPRRPNLLLAGSLLILGVLCFVVGAALAWGADPLVGFSIGGVGTMLLVIGSIMARHAMVGRFLHGEGE